MKLLVTADRVGGVWTYATELAAALTALGAEVVIAALGPSASEHAIPLPIRPELVEGRSPERAVGSRASTSSARTGLGSDGRAGSAVRVIDTGLPLDWLADGPVPVRAAAEAVATLAREVGADCVQVNSPTLAAARYPCPVVAVDHGTIAPWWRAANGTPLPESYGWLAALTREGLLAADATVAPTTAYAAEVARAYRLRRAPVEVHNGRAATPMPAAKPATAAFTAGRLWDRVKRTDLLDRVAAMTPIRAAGPLVAPHGEAVAPSRLTVLGCLSPEALAAECAGRPVFVSAASFEPFGLAVLEAAQAGCPLVLSDITTFRELWSGAARFVAGDDPADWAEAIAAARADPGSGEAARRHAARYTPAATASPMHRIYRGLVEARAAA